MYKTKQLFVHLIIASFLAGGVLACGEMDETQNQSNQEQNQNANEEDDSIAVTGTWESEFGEEVIDEQQWAYMSMIDYSNDERWAITQNPSDDEHNPDAYNRIVWTPIETNEQETDYFYYCIVDFGLETEDQARNSEKTADDSNPEEGGCGDFAWTKLTRVSE